MLLASSDKWNNVIGVIIIIMYKYDKIFIISAEHEFAAQSCDSFLDTWVCHAACCAVIQVDHQSQC